MLNINNHLLTTAINKIIIKKTYSPYTYVYIKKV